MAVSPFVVLEKAQQKIGAGVIDLDTHDFKAVLLDDSQALTPDFAGASTDGRYADLTGELANGDGYTTGGEDLANPTWGTVGSAAVFDADDTVWANLTKAGIKYIAIYDDTNANKDLLGYMDLDDTGDGVDSAGLDFTIIWAATGIFDLSQPGV